MNRLIDYTEECICGDERRLHVKWGCVAHKIGTTGCDCRTFKSQIEDTITVKLFLGDRYVTAATPEEDDDA